MSEDFREFWRDDFTCLKHAGRLITEAMRRDEQTLEDRINTGHNASSHLYFSATADDNDNSILKYQRRIPLPEFITTARSTTRKNFQMGLWTQAQLAWAICDSTVYLWKFLDPNARPYVFTTANKQHILAVGLVRPIKDVFVANVEWFLVVTTVECVYLSALYRENNSDTSSKSSEDRLLIVYNVFTLSSDGVRLTVIAGSKDGRIFLGGASGEFYAIDYSGGSTHSEPDVHGKLEQFYEGSLELGPVLSTETSIISEIGKRVREMGNGSNKRQKCKKHDLGNVTGKGSSFINLFANNEGDGVDRILVDDDRGLLFALTKNGYISLRRLSDPNRVVNKLNVKEMAIEFLRRIGRRDAMGGAYQTNAAAVGGQDMARTIAQRGVGLLKPITMQLISRSESQTYCLAIVTTGGIRLFFSMGPFSLTLGHIRGAQPLMNNNPEVDPTGGYRPSISFESTVKAAYYHKGMLVAAFTNTGDIASSIVASGPDCQLRTLKQNGKEIRQVPGGITESISYPLGDTKLAGGIIFDIGEIEETTKKSQTLLRFSASPTDQDLRRPFLPPSYSFSATKDKKSFEGSSIVPYKRQTGFEFLQQVVKSVVLGSSQSGPTRRSNEKAYHISKRSASEGFSSTAAEKKSGSHSIANQSSRLKPWLIQPRLVALQYMAAQYPPEKREVVFLNADGFHIFAKTSPLAQFALSISARGGGVSFFERFRRRECCAMGLALAMGLCPPSAHIQRQAEQLVLQQGRAPSLQRRSNQAGSAPAGTATTNADDSLVPLGYEFHSSPLCKGLIFLVSRLLRPIWHKPLVVVTDGPIVKMAGSASYRASAKVELLLDEATSSEILLPLSQLTELISRIFQHAIANVPGVTNPNADRMEVDESRNDSILNPLQARNAFASTMNLAEAVDPSRLSRKLEERNIHSLYRTLSRSCQMLNLFSILQHQSKLGSLNESIQWGLLHGVTFSEFVESCEGQDRLEGLMNNLIASTRGRDNKLSSQQIQSLTSSLSSHCYYFFSPGSQKACQGHQLAARAMTIQRGTADFFALRLKAANLFLEASSHWHSPVLITGRTIYEARAERYRDLAQTAERNGSPMALASSVLIELDDVVNAAKVCLETAANFIPQNARGSFRLMHQRNGSEARFGWEKSLYHQRQATSAAGSLSANGMRSLRQSPVKSEVTSDDAVDTCFALIFYFLERLMGTQPDLADKMLSFCSSSKDPFFLSKLYEFLLDGYKDSLLSISGPDLESWLKERQDADLLWRYFNVHNKHDEAEQLAFGLATDSSSNLPLSCRIDWLDRAVASHREITKTNNTLVTQRNEAIEKRLVAHLQERILRALQAQGLADEVTDKLNTVLLPVSELYNDFAAQYGLAEECLHIYHVCKQNNPDDIQRLWRHVICGALLPSATTRDIQIYNHLTALAAEFQLENMITLLTDNEHISQALFEDCAWEFNFQKRIAAIGKDLYESSASFVFPVRYLVRKLEELRRLVRGRLSPGWSLQFLLDAGVPALDVLEAFEVVSNEPNGLILRTISETELIEEVSGILELIEYALTNRKHMERDRLLLKLDSLRSKIDNITGSRELQDRLERIGREIRPLMQ